MKARSIVFKVFCFIKGRGLLALVIHAWEIMFFRIYQTKFKRYSGLYLKRGFHVSGQKNISLGRNFRAGYSLRLEAIESYGLQVFSPSLQIGSNVTFNDFVHIGCVERVTIGDNVLLASKIFISDHNHGYYSDRDPSLQQSPEVPPAERLLSSSPVCIEENVWIGEFVSVLPGSHIGRCSIIGANTVVNGFIPPFSIAVGNPAIVVKRYCLEENRWVPAER